MGIGDRIFHKTEAKVASRGYSRSDLKLVGVKAIANDQAKVLIGFDPNKGQVSSEDLIAFIAHKTEAKVVPHLETALAHQKEKVISCQVSVRRQTKHIAEAADMHKITAMSFMDTKDGSSWEVAEGAAGKKFLRRATEDDIDSLLASRVERVGASVSFEAITAGYFNVEVGDSVEFFSDVLRTGAVSSLRKNGQELRIVQEDQEVFIVPLDSVVKILRKNAKAEREETKKQEDFYSQIYGENFAQDLMKFGSRV